MNSGCEGICGRFCLKNNFFDMQNTGLEGEQISLEIYAIF
jgi:hypothetical protein